MASLKGRGQPERPFEATQPRRPSAFPKNYVISITAEAIGAQQSDLEENVDWKAEAEKKRELDEEYAPRPQLGR